MSCEGVRPRTLPPALAKLRHLLAPERWPSDTDDPSGSCARNMGCSMAFPERSCIVVSPERFHMDRSARIPQPPATPRPRQRASRPNRFPKTPCTSTAAREVRQFLFFQSSPVPPDAIPPGSPLKPQLPPAFQTKLFLLFFRSLND